MKFAKTLNLFVLSGLAMVASSLQGATLTTVPMQGGMVMPMLWYDQAASQLQVMMPGTIPTLTPLLVSNPSDSFDPSDPWFGPLDPSAQGASFSRRYGFMWDSLMSDPLPANTEVRIRMNSSSPGLNVYRYNGSAPKAFEPIFGTSDTTNDMSWNLLMFHPCFTAAPGTNSFTAEFEVYLANTSTGQEVPGSSTGALTFNFNNLSDGRPALNLAQRMVVGWPEPATTNWVLECAATPNAMAWTTVTNVPVMLEGQQAVVLDICSGQEFFRMRYVP